MIYFFLCFELIYCSFFIKLVYEFIIILLYLDIYIYIYVLNRFYLEGKESKKLIFFIMDESLVFILFIIVFIGLYFL